MFFWLVLNLQVVAGYDPVAAGGSLLPMTLIMLLLSSRMGALAQRIGPRLPMTVGPLLCALGVAGMTRIAEGASYVADVLPPVVVFGLGLSLTVAPLTATVLAAAPARHAGLASGVNNATARVAGLLAIAILPLVTGLSGEAYSNPDVLEPAYRIAMWVSATLLAAGGVLAGLFVRRPKEESPSVPAPPKAVRWYCGVDGPPLQAVGTSPIRSGDNRRQGGDRRAIRPNTDTHTNKRRPLCNSAEPPSLLDQGAAAGRVGSPARSDRANHDRLGQSRRQ